MREGATRWQLEAAKRATDPCPSITVLDEKRLLVVPNVASLGRDWFVRRAADVIAEIGGLEKGDVVHVVCQQQLAQAICAASRSAGATAVESVDMAGACALTNLRTVHAY